jgi:hypothetical protein
MQTVKEFLVQHFGASAENLSGIDEQYLGNQPANNPRFVCDKGGRLFVHCSGTVLMSFKPIIGMRGEVFLVFDDIAGEIWDARRAEGKEFSEIGSRPSARLRLVYSA